MSESFRLKRPLSAKHNQPETVEILRDFSTTWRVLPRWRITAGGVALHEKLHLAPGSLDNGAGVQSLGNDPSSWWSVRSLLDITPQHELDIGLRRVGSRPDPNVPAYTAIDARLGWNPTRNLGFSLVFQNAFDPSHPEWGAAGTRAEIERAVFLKVVWRL